MTINTERVSTLVRNASLTLLLFFPLALFLGPAILDTSLSLIAILFIIYTIIKQDFNCFRARWFQLFILFWTYLVIRSIFSMDQGHSLSGSLPFGRFGFFAVAICYWLQKTPNLIDKLNLSIFFTIAIVSVSTISQFYCGADIFGNEPTIHPGTIRLKSFVGKMNVGILLTFLYIPYAANICSKFSDTNTYKKLSLYWVLLCTPILAIFLSGERTAFILVMMGLIIIFISAKNARKIILSFFVILGLVISIFSFTKSDIANRQFTSTYAEIENFQHTAYGKIYKSTWSIAQDNIIFGTAPRTFYKTCTSTFGNDPNYRCATHPHNLYLEILSESGLFGLVFFGFFIFAIFSQIFKSHRTILNSPFIWGAFLAFTFRYLPFISSGSLYIAWSMAASWFMLGICLSVTKNEKA